MRSEFEKNRYWIGLFKTDVEFNGLIGEFGRYELNGSREVNHSYLEDFNSKWEAYAKAWQHQQSKVDELQKQRDSFIKAYDIEMGKNIELQKRVDAVKKLIQDYKDEEKELELKEWEQSTIYGRITIELEQALKVGES